MASGSCRSGFNQSTYSSQCALAVAASAFAAQGKKVSADYSGVIDKFDAATRTVTIKRKDNKQGDFILTDSSEITDGGKKAAAPEGGKDAKKEKGAGKLDIIELSDIDREVIIRWLTRDYRVVFGGKVISGPPR